MKIEIDTKHDSHEEIKKAISMLQHLVGEAPVSNQPQNNGYVNIFGEDSSTAQPKESTQEETPALFNIFDDDDKKQQEQPKEEEQEKSQVEIMPYI